MKVLLDENLPHALRHELPGHDVFTVHYPRWDGTKNGLLLRNAAAAGFDAMITMDSGINYQQNLATLPLAIVVLEALSNDVDDLRPLLPKLNAQLPTLTKNSVTRVKL